MDFREPEIKVVKQGWRETDCMYLISQGSGVVSIYDLKEGQDEMQDIAIRTLA